MRLSIVSDELSDDFRTAVELGVSWGIKHFELRNAWLTRVPHLPSSGLEVIKSVVAQSGIRITAISPGIFKLPLRSKEMTRHRNELIVQSFKLARELGTDKIIIFGIKRSPQDTGEEYRQVVEVLRDTAGLAGREGFTLLLENEAGWWADTGANTAQLVKDVDREALKVNWDPGNAFLAGEEPYPSGFEAIRDKVANVHIKWAARDSRGVEHYLGSGRGYLDLEGQLHALAEDGYSGFISIETHSEPRIQNSLKCLATLRETGEGLFENDSL